MYEARRQSKAKNILLKPRWSAETISHKSPPKSPNRVASFSPSLIASVIVTGISKKQCAEKIVVISPPVFCSKSAKRIKTQYKTYLIVFCFLLSSIVILRQAKSLSIQSSLKQMIYLFRAEQLHKLKYLFFRLLFPKQCLLQDLLGNFLLYLPCR